MITQVIGGAGEAVRALFRDEEPNPEPIDFAAVQREALAEGQPLPPSTLRTLIWSEVSRAEAGPPVRRTVDEGKGRARARPLAAAMLPAAGTSNAAVTLASLPDCVLTLVFSALDAPTLWRLPAVSRELGLLSTSDAPWQALLETRFAPVRWALPPGALEPVAGRSSRELFYELSTAGKGGWKQLAASSHASEASCWIVIDDVIYDVTNFMHRHPGMAASLLLFGGTDATEPFADIPHSQMAHRYMRTLEVPGLCLPRDGTPARLPPPEPSTLQQPTTLSRASRLKELLTPREGTRLKEVLTTGTNLADQLLGFTF